MKKSKATVTRTAAELAKALGLTPADGAEIALRTPAFPTRCHPERSEADPVAVSDCLPSRIRGVDESRVADVIRGGLLSILRYFLASFLRLFSMIVRHARHIVG